MQELLDRMMASAGIDRPLAETALGIILNFLSREAPDDAVSQLLDAMPEARALVSAEPAAGGFGGFGAMGALNEMTEAGLTMPQVQAVTREVIHFGRDTAGEDVVGRIVGSIPGLEMFV